MKKLFFTACCMLFIMTGCVKAQPPQPPAPEEMAKMETDQMKKELSLTSDQISQTEAINLKYAKKMGEMFNQGPGGDFDEMRKKMEELMDQKRTELANFLSADQMKKYDAMIGEQMKNRPGPPR